MEHKDRALEQGHDPNIRGRSHYANEAQVTSTDRPILETELGHEDGAMLDRPNEVEGEARDIDINATPMSEITGAPDPGTTQETIDGLDETEEAVRHAAEDITTGPRRL